MTMARNETVPDGVEGVYHCISRCVRRAFLCGFDSYSGKSFEHRKQWVQSRLKLMAEGFAVEILAFAVMSNHLHVVLKTKPDLTDSWDDEEIARRWLSVFPQNWAKGDAAALAPSDIRSLTLNKGRLEVFRRRLGNLSWFMRCLNENIARRANLEDGCKGRFWEGRFKCQALLDDSAVFTCMAYVDINPIRAGIAASPETSLNTSIYLRITANQAQEKLRLAQSDDNAQAQAIPPADIEAEKKKINLDSWLSPMTNNRVDSTTGVPGLGFTDYVNLLDWTGRQIREKARGSIPDNLEPILIRLRVERENWLETVCNYKQLFSRATGREKSLRDAARRAGKSWFRGINSSRLAFS
ncbi:MAG: transposase [Pseudomonadota bacterium]